MLQMVLVKLQPLGLHLEILIMQYQRNLLKIKRRIPVVKEGTLKGLVKINYHLDLLNNEKIIE